MAARCCPGRDRPGGASVKSTAGEAVQLLGAGAGNATGTASALAMAGSDSELAFRVRVA